MNGDHAHEAGIGIDAPAKLNLYLHVIGRRDDGYHLLDSLVAFATIGDRVTVRPAAELSLQIDGPFAAALTGETDNLVLAAARALMQAADIADGAAITLTKNLPVASGIGGGSADAAAAIKALVRLWGVHPATHDLSGLALSLGADVPACLFGRPVFMGGIGDVLEPAPALPDAPMVLVNPGIGVATPAVFGARQGAFGAAAPFDDDVADVPALATMLTDRRNDLTAAAVALTPEISEVLKALDSATGCLLARMSGSGATCFGLFAGRADAEAAAIAIGAANPGWWVTATRLRA
ncbi:MAG: 4-(cytidine 5'-diphospho)-2-C-methyl-D-erythritol kinase [Magnetovibrio sp.]|nr:4-(cytidine 5'-diphospho)-2-C-methyl-D-erythritol kinase [Magnetovibrio sp.]